MHYNAAFVHSVEWSALTLSDLADLADLAVLGIAAAATGAKWSSAGAAARCTMHGYYISSVPLDSRAWCFLPAGVHQTVQP